MQALKGLRHAVSRQRVHIVGLGLLKKLGHVGGGDGIATEARLESLEPKCCQHQQRRYEGHEQPRHKGEVNTAKVSEGLRIVTGPPLEVGRRLDALRASAHRRQYAGIRACA